MKYYKYTDGTEHYYRSPDDENYEYIFFTEQKLGFHESYKWYRGLYPTHFKLKIDRKKLIEITEKEFRQKEFLALL